MTVNSRIEELRLILPEKHSVILDYLSGLAEEEGLLLIDQLLEVDWTGIEKVIEKPDVSKLRKPSIISIPERETFQGECEKRGKELLQAGVVANLIVAGGQGTRLGYEGPKGCYFLEELDKSIFEIHVRRHLSLQQEYGKAIPLLIMTGSHNHEETKSFFESNGYWGLEPLGVTFFQQGSVPSFSEKMELVLASAGSLLLNPNGHGGCVEALIKSGTLDKLNSVGIKFINYIQVDNILAPLDDEFTLGLADIRGVDVVTKVVEKASPEERVGCLVKIDGTDQIVEYSDVTEEQTKFTDEDGELLLRWGNTAMHVFSVEFLSRYKSELSLPYHKSAPKNATIFKAGQMVPAKVMKFERFIFDLLLEAKSSIGVAVRRESEFAPIKNSSGNDSPATATALYKSAKL